MKRGRGNARRTEEIRSEARQGKLKRRGARKGKGEMKRGGASQGEES